MFTAKKKSKRRNGRSMLIWFYLLFIFLVTVYLLSIFIFLSGNGNYTFNLFHFYPQVLFNHSHYNLETNHHSLESLLLEGLPVRRGPIDTNKSTLSLSQQQIDHILLPELFIRPNPNLRSNLKRDVNGSSDALKNFFILTASG